jgi:RNA polymerase sigma factor (sigma-70 family)
LGIETGDTSSKTGVRLLRERFLAIARCRVPADVVEDVVQDAMLVVVRRIDAAERAELIDGLPRLAWCFQVLRNTIGNHYLRTARRGGDRSLEHPDEHAGQGSTPAEALEAKELRQALTAALAEMRAADGQCARYIGRLLDGSTPAALAAEEGVEQGALYRRMYRCRTKLRDLLARRGIRV